MTALITGEKTKAGVLSMAATVARADANVCGEQQLATLFELAENHNWATGIVTTTSVTHATPAAGFAHSPERNWEDDSDLPDKAKANGCRDIARQFVEFSHGNGIDVLLGGGRSHFLPKGSKHAKKSECTEQLGGNHAVGGKCWTLSVAARCSCNAVLRKHIRCICIIRRGVSGIF